MRLSVHALADQVPPLGHIPRILGRMKASNDAIPRACAMVIHVLADSDVSGRGLYKWWAGLIGDGGDLC